jgi:hypothetical protein
MPTGTEIIHNPAPGELEVEVGFSKESELLERHGGRIHLIDGHDRIAIELGCLVEHREHGRPELVEDHTVYVLPEGTSLFEARRIGYHLLENDLPRTPISCGRHVVSPLKIARSV